MTEQATDTTTQRFALGLEYDGSAFRGFETQVGQPSVQAVLEHALQRVAAQPVRVVCAGRTDTGVHASGQVVHFDTTARRPQRAWVLGVNSALPAEVAVCWVRAVPDDFHARFSARRRHYRYQIYNRRIRAPLARARATWWREPLDVARMQAASRCLLGEHDFSALRAAGCQARSPVRTVHAIELRRHGPLLVMDVCANAYLQHMVRNIVGLLVAVGSGRRPVAWVGEVLESRDRRRGGITARPDGLCLTAVEYPQEYGLPRVSPCPPLWYSQSFAQEACDARL